MTSYGMAGYRSAYDEYEDENPDPQEMHPSIRRQARRIVLCERRSLLMKWWISLVGAIAIIGCLTSAILAGIGLVIQAAAVAGFSALATAYLVSVAHRPSPAR